ncbi:hypothetical protein SKDZ_15G5100 [Saccharomyces kudriavzevii ZP591]|uniref:Rdr1p n=1 Tax=Saccharomyces cerevisiae x Saccharomyces kudriavzevii (strain VIN7) TaxID=1095631 RepID=H0H1N6_SACCK|nr:Rdr1p [Saccharomyces cerevisiae x Saccharomyces kudriavzevii VIN7]CAI4052423.1 hypothetical protein SKDZ_15G5100 [Saccharomyces kudriavzevii ZP591]
MVSSGSNSQPYKRQRVRKACVPCRERKRKCNGKSPCEMCIAYGYACHYTDGDGSSTSPRVDETPYGTDNRPYSLPNILRNEARSVDAQNVTNQNMIDPIKSRYTIQHSAVAFPRCLGLELRSTNPPRLHSFAWHCGIRPEENPNSHILLSGLVTKEEYYRISKVYFSVVHPIFDVVDPEQLAKNVERYWDGDGKMLEYGAVIAGVIALGSFFLGSLGHPREMDVVQYAKGILDDPTFCRIPTVEQVSAWVLRTIYLRATSRPHVAWLASCITIHLSEAIGLHHEIDREDLVMTNNVPLRRTTEVSEHTRRLFWCAWSINTILSYDYGRSSVTLNRITCKSVKETEGNHTVHLVALAQLIPQDCVNANATQLLQALAAVHKSPNAHPFLSLTKSDICLSLYRRLRLLNHILDKSVVLQIIDIGNTALSAAYALVKLDQAWWNVLSTSFQYVCVLLAIDTPESLSHVAAAMRTLDNITQVLGTHIAYEAQKTAKLLLEDSMKKKRQEIQQLERATHQRSTVETTHLLDIDWDVLLDPSDTLNFM